MSGPTGAHDAVPVSAPEELDRTVLAKVANGDVHALESLYDRYRGLAFSIALRMTRDATLSEDIVQDAFVGVWRNAGRYVEARGSVRTWVLSIVHHRAIDAIRRRRPAGELPGADVAPPASLTIPDVWPEVAGRLDRDAIAAALGAISSVQREAIELAYYGGLTQQEIAERTGTPLGTVKSRMRLGLINLRRALLGQDPEADEPT